MFPRQAIGELVANGLIHQDFQATGISVMIEMIDKVVSASAVFQLPAPDFRVGETRTTAVLFADQDFAEMSKPDRIRACYQHCCLKHVSNQHMSNQSLRERFKLSESKAATVSLVIGATKDDGLIKADESESTSTRYARYLPFWA